VEGVTPEVVAARLAEVEARVAAVGVDPKSLTVVAVTKGFGPETAQAALEAGVADLGENYAAELESKAAVLSDATRWHFLGRMQRNKLSWLARWVHAWHSLDRVSAAEALSKVAPGARVFVEVNLSGQAERPGCAPQDLDELVERCRKLPLDLRGLMALGVVGDPEATRRAFRWLAGASRRLGLSELSMGMSDDFEIAVQEGATTLRLGRAIFGPRPPARPSAR